MRRLAAPPVAVAALLAACAPVRPARADGVPFGWPQFAFMSAPVSVLPSEGGVILGSSEAAFVFGWSWQRRSAKGCTTASPATSISWCGRKVSLRRGAASAIATPVARPEVAVMTGHIGTTILLGWNLF